jgi:hypothetical protein
MQTIMGANSAGYIDLTATPPGKPTTTQQYLLWTAGADGVFGFGVNPQTGQPWKPTDPGYSSLKTDDVCNFDIPANLRK